MTNNNPHLGSSFDDFLAEEDWAAKVLGKRLKIELVEISHISA